MNQLPFHVKNFFLVLAILFISPLLCAVNSEKRKKLEELENHFQDGAHSLAVLNEAPGLSQKLKDMLQTNALLEVVQGYRSEVIPHDWQLDYDMNILYCTSVKRLCTFMRQNIKSLYDVVKEAGSVPAKLVPVNHDAMLARIEAHIKKMDDLSARCDRMNREIIVLRGLTTHEIALWDSRKRLLVWMLFQTSKK